MLSMLALIQEFADSKGLPRPMAIIGASDKTSRQYFSLFKKTIRKLYGYNWPVSTVRRTFSSIAAQDQGALITLFGADYNGLIQESGWNDTRHMRIYGPVPEQIWQALQTLPNAGPDYQHWISNGHLYISPQLTAGDTIAFMVRSKWICTDTTGATAKEFPSVDTDVLTIPDEPVILLFEAFWREQKGESGWENAYNDALTSIARYVTKDGMSTLNIDSNPRIGPRPGIVIPPGSWNV
jgi:hypothetical protein